MSRPIDKKKSYFNVYVLTLRLINFTQKISAYNSLKKVVLIWTFYCKHYLLYVYDRKRLKVYKYLLTLTYSGNDSYRLILSWQFRNCTYVVHTCCQWRNSRSIEALVKVLFYVYCFEQHFGVVDIYCVIKFVI